MIQSGFANPSHNVFDIKDMKCHQVTPLEIAVGTVTMFQTIQIISLFQVVLSDLSLPAAFCHNMSSMFSVITSAFSIMYIPF